jgi:hypothetical protein
VLFNLCFLGFVRVKAFFYFWGYERGFWWVSSGLGGCKLNMLGFVRVKVFFNTCTRSSLGFRPGGFEFMFVSFCQGKCFFQYMFAGFINWITSGLRAFYIFQFVNLGTSGLSWFSIYVRGFHLVLSGYRWYVCCWIRSINKLKKTPKP